MYKLTILFRIPPDIARFEHDWAHTFVPAAEAMPGILRVEVSSVDGGPDGPSEFHKIHEFYFADRQAMDQAMNSEPGTHAGVALHSFARGLFTIVFSEALEDSVRPTGEPPQAAQTVLPADPT